MNGRSLKRSTGTEYASTPATTSTNVTPAATDPCVSNHAMKGTTVTTLAHTIAR